MVATRPICHVVAGPNGAGKSTFALRYLPQRAGEIDFVNPDLMAQGASPLDIRLSAFDAARQTLNRIRGLMGRGESFGFETTLSGRSQLTLFSECRDAGFEIDLYYLWMPDAHPLPSRIRHRVLNGGHDVPEADVMRRFERSRTGLRAYADLADRVLVFDVQPQIPELIWRRNGSEIAVDPARAAAMKKGLGL